MALAAPYGRPLVERGALGGLSAPQRGGERSHRGPEGPTRDQLYNEAKQRGIEGRSNMTKQQLARALGR